MENKALYERFEDLLKEFNTTPYGVSKMANVSQPTLSDWKLGKSEPKRKTLEKICEAYGKNLSYFYGEDIPAEDNAPYYLNDDARDMAQFMFENPEYKVLFDASRKVKKEDIQFVKEMIDRMSTRD